MPLIDVTKSPDLKPALHAGLRDATSTHGPNCSTALQSTSIDRSASPKYPGPGFGEGHGAVVELSISKFRATDTGSSSAACGKTCRLLGDGGPRVLRPFP